MTPIDKVFMLEINTEISRELLLEIYSRGYSRIPVYENVRQNVTGVLMAKDLILFNPNKKMTIKQISSVLREIEFIDGSSTCEHVLTHFQKGYSHIAILVKPKTADQSPSFDPYLEQIGLVTLEDIVEEILN